MQPADWLDRALELAHMTLDPVWPAYILARKAQLAVDMHDPVHATGLARAAIAASGGDYRARHLRWPLPMLRKDTP